MSMQRFNMNREKQHEKKIYLNPRGSEKSGSKSAPIPAITTSSSLRSQDRQQWGSIYEFMMSVLGFSVGLGNIWRFPYLCYKHGGGSFLICYFVAIITVGLPYFFLELALGQSAQAGILGVWKICPLFKGVGWAMMVISFYFDLYYIVILAWALLYFFNTFKSPLPWRDCGHWWNTPNCFPATCKDVNCSIFSENQSVSSVQEYWQHRLLQLSDRIENIGKLQWELATMLLILWVTCYFVVWKGVRLSGKIVFITVLTPYVLVIIMLWKAMYLPGALIGVQYYLSPNLDKFLDIKVWFEALSHALYSFGVGYGPLVAFGSYNDYNNNIYRQMLALTAVDVLTSILMGFTFFSIVGFMSFIHKKPIHEVVSTGPDLAFVVYPTFALELKWPIFWAMVIFSLLLSVGIDSQFGSLEGFITALLDEYPFEYRYQREFMLLGVCVIKFLAGLICVTQGGMYVVYLMDYYAIAGWNVSTVVLFEGCAVAYVYGLDKFYTDLEMMLSFKPSIWWKICWLLISPSIVFSLAIIHIINLKPLKYHNYYYPLWANVVGCLMSLSSIMCIPLYMIYYLTTDNGTLKERVNKSIQPSFELETLNLISEETLPRPEIQIQQRKTMKV